MCLPQHASLIRIQGLRPAQACPSSHFWRASENSPTRKLANTAQYFRAPARYRNTSFLVGDGLPISIRSAHCPTDRAYLNADLGSGLQSRRRSYRDSPAACAIQVIQPNTQRRAGGEFPALLNHARSVSGLSGARHPSIRQRITTAHSACVCRLVRSGCLLDSVRYSLETDYFFMALSCWLG